MKDSVGWWSAEVAGATLLTSMVLMLWSMREEITHFLFLSILGLMGSLLTTILVGSLTRWLERKLTAAGGGWWAPGPGLLTELLVGVPLLRNGTVWGLWAGLFLVLHAAVTSWAMLTARLQSDRPLWQAGLAAGRWLGAFSLALGTMYTIFVLG